MLQQLVQAQLKLLQFHGSGGGVNVQGEVRAYTGDGETGFTVSSGANAKVLWVLLQQLSGDTNFWQLQVKYL